MHVESGRLNGIPHIASYTLINITKSPAVNMGKRVPILLSLHYEVLNHGLLNDDDDHSLYFLFAVA